MYIIEYQFSAFIYWIEWLIICYFVLSFSNLNTDFPLLVDPPLDLGKTNYKNRDGEVNIQIMRLLLLLLFIFLIWKLLLFWSSFRSSSSLPNKLEEMRFPYASFIDLSMRCWDTTRQRCAPFKHLSAPQRP